MLHITTEVGKVGKKERERRHFPDIHNRKGPIPCYQPRGRRYIPHGYGIYEDWRPHPHNVQIEYSEVGPDWKSSIRPLPDPENPKYPAAEIFPNNWKAMRPYPFTYMRSGNEWLLDPGLSNNGIKCTFEGEHMATRTSNDEITHSLLFGRGRNVVVIDKRNGIPEASKGDKSYQVPEYAPEFHKGGSTLPVVNFGKFSPRKSTDTFVPLQPLPKSPREPFQDQERKRQKSQEVKLVKALDEWRPATPLHLTIPQDEKKER